MWKFSSLSLVRYRGNDYSVPTQYGHRQVWVKGYVHEVVIACTSEVIARHQRSYEREAVVFDPLHYPTPRTKTCPWGPRISPCSNRKRGRWTRPHHWPAGSCPRASLNCGDCSKRD
jgi:hypothetical protein